MKQNNQLPEFNAEMLRKLVTFARYGIANELKEMQAGIIAQSQFGDATVTGIHHFNPLRPSTDARKLHDDLVGFSIQVQHLLNHLEDLRTDASAKEFFRRKHQDNKTK